MSNSARGSSFDQYLEDEGILDEAEAVALRRLGTEMLEARLKRAVDA